MTYDIRKKGSVDVGIIFKMIILVVVLILVVAVIIFQVGRGEEQIDDNTISDKLGFAEAYCETECTKICYGKPECEDTDVCSYSVPWSEEIISLNCKNLHSDIPSGSSSTTQPIISGKFKPCALMGIMFNAAGGALTGVKFKICEVADPTTCIQNIDVAGVPQAAVADSFTLCPGVGCSPDADDRVTAEFNLPCTNELKEKVSYMLTIEPISSYSSRDISLSWVCPSVTFPEGIHPGGVMPISFNNEISAAEGGMNADLRIKDGCYNVDSSYDAACSRPDNLIYVAAETTYKIDMPHINPNIFTNSIILDIKLGGNTVCTTGDFFTWSCPAKICTDEGALGTEYTVYDQASGIHQPTYNPKCNYMLKTACALSCYDNDRPPYLVGSCKDTNMQVKIARIYPVSKYVYRCVGGKESTPYTIYPSSSFICRFDAGGNLDYDTGSIDNYPAYKKSMCDASNAIVDTDEADASAQLCKCNILGMLDAAGAEANCNPTYTCTQSTLDPTSDNACICNSLGQIDVSGGHTCPSYKKDSASIYRPATPAHFHIEIRNTGAAPVEVDSSKLTVTFDGIPQAGLFVKKLKSDASMEPTYNFEQILTLQKQETIIYEFNTNIGGIGTQTYQIDASLDYTYATTSKNQPIYVYYECCNGCTCTPAEDFKCNTCSNCKTDFLDVCTYK